MEGVMRKLGCLGFIVLALLAAWAIGAWLSSPTPPGAVAREAAAQGHPCEAEGLHEGSEAQQNKVAEECTAQKNHEAKAKEATAEDEAIREGERLKEEG
jgi:hypothetical protein